MGAWEAFPSFVVCWGFVTYRLVFVNIELVEIVEGYPALQDR